MGQKALAVAENQFNRETLSRSFTSVLERIAGRTQKQTREGNNA